MSSNAFSKGLLVLIYKKLRNCSILQVCSISSLLQLIHGRNLMDRWVPYYVKVPRWSKRCVLFVILITIFLILFGPSYLRYLFWREVDVRGNSLKFLYLERVDIHPYV